MITEDKIRVYHKFDGDIDGFSRSGGCGDITDDDWRWLDRIFMRLHMVLSVDVSKEFKEITFREIRSMVDSEKTAQLLQTIANKKLA
ncbi:hypothetical protein HW115_19290 [Verrucomicrobiaceae bacterium N1E253]|uniref:Uncharacterized protein n=1 Tax=Oceaniferula marina TaxID=2748318 RepID=A0A851GL32_9BACT|nr:hypothetical protein [Oceaniferula marina]NWK57642.1 hypothetical protein [Oceaniferula marina]NWK57772.1 hypothetical protein [Oceaniferula marina]